MPYEIRIDDLSGEQAQELLALHVQGMQVYSPPELVHALDLSALRTPDITVWTVWDGDAIAGIGAMRIVSKDQGELKSMRTHPDHLRQGVAALLLEHIICEAEARGLKRLSLETGSGPAFDPALALYRRRGFIDGPLFGGYAATDFNQFLHLAL